MITKKRLAVLLVALPFLLLSCDPPWDSFVYTFSHSENFKTIYDVQVWHATNVKYIADGVDSWKIPEETYKEGGGDCEDYAILFAYFCWELGFDPKIPIAYIAETNSYHAFVEIDGVYYEPLFGAIYSFIPFEIKYIMSYNEAVYKAYYLKGEILGKQEA